MRHDSDSAFIAPRAEGGPRRPAAVQEGHARPTPGRTRPARRGWVVLVLLLVAGGGAFAWQRFHPVPPAATAKAPAPVPVRLAPVQQGPFPVVLGGLGTVQAYNTVQVRTRVDGEILRIAFKEGQMVHKGDLLVQVDPRPYQAAFDQAKAKKTQDEANLRNAKADLERYTKLGDYASRQQTDTQAATVAQLTAQVAADQAAIDNAETQLGYATIRAPLDGVTGFRQVDTGNIVNAATQTGIVTITQIEPITVVYTAPESELPAVAKAFGSGPVPVEAWTSDGLTKLSDGALSVINNQVDTATGTIRLKASFANADHALWPGLSVSTRMRVGVVQEAVTVPDDAVQHGPKGLYAFVVDKAQKAHQQAITVGRSGGGRTLVRSGLSPGQSVIIEGQSRVQDGGLVAGSRPTETARAETAATGAP
ncbi:efflux RND transporter periplasmic adaptor subunit [Methylobacterium sp. ID0610]|uniref:efflux RND transporter periplasmic adaptor subunit n=1 Tax=Methylobacterium carpenticola TaxID=3344827 RepID=UPI0036C2698B